MSLYYASVQTALKAFETATAGALVSQIAVVFAKVII